MQRLSSVVTVFQTKISPWLFLGVIIFGGGMMAWAGDSQGGMESSFISRFAFYVVVGFVGFFLMRSVVSKIADEVFLDGDRLIVRKNGGGVVIELSEVIDVERSAGYITLMVSKIVFGRRLVTFLPPWQFARYKDSPTEKLLRERIAEAKRKVATQQMPPAK